MGQAANKPRRQENEAICRVRNLRISPQKLNLVAESIRGKTAQKALLDLEFNKKRISQDVLKGLQSAIANAENNHGLDIDRLYVKEAYVGKALVMKRFRARARGRAFRILKPFSHLTIVVAEKEIEAAPKKEKKAAPKKETAAKKTEAKKAPAKKAPAKKQDAKKETK